MKKVLCIVAILGLLAVPVVSHAECKKHVALAESATLFDKQPASGKANVVARVAAGNNLLFLDKKEGAFQVETVDPGTKAKIVGWVDKKYVGKPVWLDTETFQVCESNAEGRMGKGGRGAQGKKGDGKEKKGAAQG